MEDNTIWYNKEGRIYNCSNCSIPNCNSRNATSKNTCLLDRHEVTTQKQDAIVISTSNFPEKVYIPRDPEFPQYPNIWWERESDGSNVEYTRTDAFIRRAEKWLNEHILDYVYAEEWGQGVGVEGELFNDFKKYMKGE